MSDGQNVTNTQNLESFIGKTLKEVKEVWSNIRVMRAGPVGFYGTADYRPNRLNVELGSENLTFTKKVMKIGDEDFEIEEVDASTLDNGIIKRVWRG